MNTRQQHTLQAIFQAGLERVNPYQMIRYHVRLLGTVLEIELEDVHQSLDLKAFERIVLLGAGKATAPMAQAFEDILGDRISRGLIVVKYGHTVPLRRVETIEAGHPEPDENGVRGASGLMDLAAEADARTLVITLISGGGSALLPLPLHSAAQDTPAALSLADKQAVTRALLRSGADITEINCVRKHLSGIKGGRLLQQLAPARSLNFILSDVVGDDVSSIASGLTSADPTTFDQAWAVFEKYDLLRDIPETVLNALELGKNQVIPETLKPGDPALSTSSNILIGTNSMAMAAAGEKAQSLGYQTRLLTTRISGEAREVARLLAGVAADVRSAAMLAAPPVCIISGGEPVVTLNGQGKGGRNQEMALAFLAEIQRNPSLFTGVTFLAASTDGNDGPTDAAGAFASPEILEQADQAGLSITASLRNNDSYHFFEAIEALYTTGPTNTNVCDLHILVID